MVKDEARDPFDGWVTIDDEDRLAQLLQRLDQRIIVTEDHLVIELAIDPLLDDQFDVAEITDHVPRIERVGPNFDFGNGVVAMGMFACAIVVEETMAVAEIYALGDRIHGQLTDSPRNDQLDRGTQ